MTEPLPFEISPKEGISLIQQSEWILLDVRELEEWEYGHIPGAKHVPMSSMSPESFKEYSPEQKMLIICRTGGRSTQVTRALRNMGFSNACNFGGGMMGYNLFAENHIPVLH